MFLKLICLFLYRTQVSKEIADYIHNGYLNHEKLNQIIAEIINEIKRKEGTEEDKLIQEIRNWRELKDEDFKPLIDKIFAKIDTGEFSLMAYPVIFAEFLQIEFYKIYDFEVTPEIIEMFKKGIDKSKQNHKYLESFRYKIPHWNDRDSTPAKKKYNEISRYVGDANDFALGKEYENISETVMNNLRLNNSKELLDNIVNPNNLNSPFFESVNAKSFFDLLIIADNQTVHAFNEGIYRRFGDGEIASRESVYMHEKEFFEKLHAFIIKHIEGIGQREISIVQFIDLERNLRRFTRKD